MTVSYRRSKDVRIFREQGTAIATSVLTKSCTRKSWDDEKCIQQKIGRTFLLTNFLSCDTLLVDKGTFPKLKEKQMKSRFTAVILSLLLCALPVLASEHFTYNNRFSDDSSFTILFPEPDADQKIEQSVSDSKTDEGTTYRSTVYSLSEQKDTEAFFAAYVDYPSERDNSIASLDKALNGGFTTAKLAIVPDSFENSALAGLFAREGAATNGTLDAYMRVAVSGSRMWLVLVVFDKSAHATQADADEFFSTLSRK